MARNSGTQTAARAESSILRRVVGGTLFGSLARLISVAILLSSLYSWWAGAQASAPTDARAELNRAGCVLLAFDQVILPIKDYAKTGDADAPGEFQAKSRRFRDVLATLQADAQVRRVAEALLGQLGRVEAFGHEVMASGPRPSQTAARLGQLERLRDEAVLIVNDLREADLKSGAPSPGIAGQLGGVALTVAGACCAGGVALARFLVA